MKYYSTLFFLLFLASCNNKSKSNNLQLSDTQAFKTYWNKNNAEINSYDWQQTQDQKCNNGEVIMIFTNEDFRLDKQVKPEFEAKEKTIEVLKLNFIKKGVTGIDDYSIYTSVFTPVQTNTFPTTLKVTHTNQNWYGQSFLQLNYQQNGYRVIGKSYFEEEVDDDFHIESAILEDELWSKIRLLTTQQLPTGNLLMIPSMTYLRFCHKKAQPEMAKITLESYKGDSTFRGKNLMSYQINFPESKRNLSIIFEQNFPHQIIGWEEKFELRKQMLSSKAVWKATIQNPH
jgi:hypothetical protein